MKYQHLKVFLKEYCDYTGKTAKEALKDLTEEVWYQEELNAIFSAIAYVIEKSIGREFVLSIVEKDYRTVYYSFGTTTGIPLYIGTGKLPLFNGLSLSEIEKFLEEVVKVSRRNYKATQDVEIEELCNLFKKVYTQLLIGNKTHGRNAIVVKTINGSGWGDAKLPKGTTYYEAMNALYFLVRDLAIDLKIQEVEHADTGSNHSRR